jgi:hypothetical protein
MPKTKSRKKKPPTRVGLMADAEIHSDSPQPREKLTAWTNVQNWRWRYPTFRCCGALEITGQADILSTSWRCPLRFRQ